jgi:DNA mismatch repair protein MutH
MDIKTYERGVKMKEEEKIEITQEELLEIIKRLGSEIVELRYELKTTKEELKRVKRWVGQVSEFAIKKSIQGGQK